MTPPTGAASAASSPASAGSSTASPGASVTRKSRSAKAAEARVAETRSAVRAELEEFAGRHPQRIDEIRNVMRGELKAHAVEHPYPQPQPVPSNKGWFVAIFALLLLVIGSIAAIAFLGTPKSREDKAEFETKLRDHGTLVENKTGEIATKIGKAQGEIVAAIESNTKALNKAKDDVLNVVAGSTQVLKDTISAEAIESRKQADSFRQAAAGEAAVAAQANAELGKRLTSAQQALEEMKKAAEEQLALAKAGQKQTPPPADQPSPLPTNPPQPPVAGAPTETYGPDAGQTGAAGGRAYQVRKWREYPYPAGVQTDRYCADKFRKGEIRIVRPRDSKMTVTQWFSGPGFFGKRQPATSTAPQTGTILAFSDASEIAFQADKDIVVWELD